MKLELRHKKIITKCNYDNFIEVSNKKGTTQQKAISELYAKNKIIIGCWSHKSGVSSVSIKLNKRIKNYNKNVI